jgi:CubicO group peptidase (beta-lactamase class C family)
MLDMTTGLRYSEDYADPDADVWTYSAAGNPLPKPADYKGPQSYFEYLQTVAKQGEHGVGFGYKTINSDALGWIIARVSGKSVADLLSERIWSRMGAEQDAYYTVDSIGTPFAGGGLNAGLRDIARIGQLLLDDGIINGERLVPEAAIRSISNGGDKAAFEKAGYANASRLELSRHVVGVAQCARRLHGARRARSGDLYRSGRAHGHCPLLFAPNGRQCRQRSDDAAGLRGGCRTSDEKAVALGAAYRLTATTNRRGNFSSTRPSASGG